MKRAVLGGLVITLCVFVPVITAAAAAQYYVSPDGSDDAPGTREQPWQSIAKVNAALQPGDTAVFLPGKYEGTITPANSGTATAPITYRSAEPHAARLRKTGPADFLIKLDGHEHLVIEGFYLDGGGGSWQEVDGVPFYTMRIATTASWLFATGCRHLTVRGCEMRNSATGFYSFEISNSSQVRVVDNLFSRDNPSPVDMVHFINCEHVLFEGNSLMRAGHSALTISESNNIAVRGNVLHNEWGRNHIIWHSTRVLFEGNILTRARDSAGSAGSQSQTTHDDSIIRFNRFFDNLGTVIEFDGRMYAGVSPTGRFRQPFWVRNNRIYHNTFTNNPDYPLSLRAFSSANVFQNNILYHNDMDGGNIQIVRRDTEDAGNRFVANLLRGTVPGQAVVFNRGEYHTAAEADAATPVFGGFWSEFDGTVDADPAFAGPVANDFRLAPGSAAIDAGRPLALAVGEGTGHALPVNDGYPFYDGFGIDGEQGDFITVGFRDVVAQVQRVELRGFRTAILHLDRSVSWTDGMPVSFPWAGEAPDIGAFAHAAPDPVRIIALARPAVAAPGEQVAFELDTLGKQAEAVTWRFDNGPVVHEAAPVHGWNEPGHYAVTVRATFADGRQAVDAVFIKVENPRLPDTPLVQVDFENDSFRVHWGYHFKFYRGHQSGANLVPRPGGEGLCMHMFYDPKKNNNTTAQLVPGLWDIDTYPFIRFSYRIPEGVPVAVEVNTFRTGLGFTTSPDRPVGFVLGGTPGRAARFTDLGAYTLIADGQWHEITMDVRKAREVYPELQYLRQFMFFLNWREDRGQEMWFDDFAILPE